MNLEAAMPTILIVDNHSAFRSTFSEVLQNLEPGITIVTTDSCRKALRIQQQAPADLVFVDIGLPDCNGLDLVSGMKETSPHSHYFVITNSKDTIYETEAYRKGANGFITKDELNKQTISKIFKSAKAACQYRPQAPDAIIRGLTPT